MAGPAPDVQTPELDARLLAQKQNLDALLQRYTDGHPDVIRTRTLIADLEGQKRKEIDVLRRKLQQTGEVPIAQVNPAAVELSRIYSAAQVQVASLRARVVEYEARVQRVHQQLKVAPQLEAELAQLNRDYQIHQRTMPIWWRAVNPLSCRESWKTLPMWPNSASSILRVWPPSLLHPIACC